MYQYRRERLLELIDTRFAGVRKGLSDASGWSEARISQILSPTYREGRAFSEKIARKLEDDLRMEKMYFDQGAAPSEAEIASANAVPAHAQAVRVVDKNAVGIVQIQKVHLRLSAGIMGFKTEPDYHDGATFNVDLDWVEKKRFTPERLVAIRISGRSMEPSLHEDDIVVINTADTRPVDGEAFAVNFGGEAVVKRLARDAGQWWLMSDNADQVKYHRKLCDGDDCIIVGRVVLKKSEHI